jgi:hypothetical protein
VTTKAPFEGLPDFDNAEHVEHLDRAAWKAARSVARIFQNWGSHGWDVSGQEYTTTAPVEPSELHAHAWAKLMEYGPADFEHLGVTLRRDLLDRSSELMKQTHWTEAGPDAEGNRWSQKWVDVSDHGWLFGIRLEDFRDFEERAEPEPVRAEVLAKLRAEYPTLCALAEHGDNAEATATALGVARTTVQRRKARELAKLAGAPGLLDTIADIHGKSWRAAPRLVSGPAYSEGYALRSPNFSRERPSLTVRPWTSPRVLTLAEKHAGQTTPLGTPVADLVRAWP